MEITCQKCLADYRNFLSSTVEKSATASPVELGMNRRMAYI